MVMHPPAHQPTTPVQLDLPFPAGLHLVTPPAPQTDWRVHRDLAFMTRLADEQPITQMAVVATLADGSVASGWTAECDVFAILGGLAHIQRRISETIE
jgi:hypothetical protein